MSTATPNLVRWERKGAVAVVTLDNPPLNVMSQALVDRLETCLKEIDSVQELTAIVLTGAGKAFMAGADIKEFTDWKSEEAEKAARRIDEVFELMGSMRHPTIAAINGLALGGGCELALACDLRVIDETAKIGLPEIKLGLFPGGGGTQRLPRLVGPARAKEIMYLGAPLSAGDALAIGLVNRVAPSGQALVQAMELAETIAGGAGLALGYIKQAVNQGSGLPIGQALSLEANLFGKVFVTEDANEGTDAFLNKRAARFKNR